MMEDNEMRTAIETREYDNGGVVDMQDNGDGRQGRMWRRAAENHSSGDAGKLGQRLQRYRNMDMEAEEMRDRQ